MATYWYEKFDFAFSYAHSTKNWIPLAPVLFLYQSNVTTVPESIKNPLKIPSKDSTVPKATQEHYLCYPQVMTIDGLNNKIWKALGKIPRNEYEKKRANFVTIINKEWIRNVSKQTFLY